ncbi:MAG TPA: glycosyltransferase [Chthoniobacterales bacterium]|jgi:glycosyltransferase involved in cell wall biosynthesis/peptidoglycan/xylan/chitin deacetylase (PgdA/CDA1 family)|nr:glycosyltransferase [Chthoniobacterales bacterium]
MDNEPLVSVITIFLNGDRFITEAIESVRAQTYSHWELLLVDDGSTDRATNIAQDFAARCPDRIRYLEHAGHANRGMSASRNLGLRHARGEFISYLDADDVWRPDKLADQSRLLRAHPEAAYVYGPLELWRSWTGRPADTDEIQDLGLTTDRLIQPPELLNLFLRNEKNIPSGIMVRASMIERVGGYDERFKTMCEDQIVHAKICLSYPVYACSKSWYRYRQHPDSCNAIAWRTSGFEPPVLEFLRWLETHLVERGAAQGEVWETLQSALKRFRPPSFVQRLPGRLRRQTGRARRLAARIRHRTRAAIFPPPVILCYHRVYEPERDPHQLSVSRDHFREQLEVIRRIGEPMTLDQLADALPSRDFPRRGVVLTFDDGYLDNLENALPILREAGVPAIIYIVTGQIGRKREFWWDDLERLVLGATALPDVLRLQINGRAREWSPRTPDEATARRRLFFDLHLELRPLAASQQAEVLGHLRSITGVPADARPLYRCLTAEELATLAREPLVTLGAHTVTHCDLDYRTKAEQAAEIAGSKQTLEEILGRPVEHFSYPFGSFNDDCLAACAENRFRTAVSVLEGPVWPQSDRFALPRCSVRNWNGPVFERELKRLFRG